MRVDNKTTMPTTSAPTTRIGVFRLLTGSGTIFKIR